MVESKELKGMDLAQKHFTSINKLGFDIDDLQSLSSGFFELSSDPMFILDSLGRVLLANSVFCQITGYTDSYLVGKNLGFLFSGYDDSDAALQGFLTELMKDGYWHGPVICRSMSGRLINMDAKFASVINPNSLNKFFFGVCQILSGNASSSDGVSFNPNLDSLTGLLSLASFIYRLDYAISVSEKYSSNLSLFLIDIDNFSSLNENYGYIIGDKVIKKFAIELKKFIGRSDCIARIKDDKFLLLFTDVKGQRQIELKAYEIFSHFQQKGLFGSKIGNVPFTMAVSSYPGNHNNAEDLIQSAIDTISKGKDSGGNRILYSNLLNN